MEEGAKRRLIGAAVVIALLVIFVPMFLEKEPAPPVSEQEMKIPPRPDFDQGDEASLLGDPVEPTASEFHEYEEPPREEATLPRELPPPEFYDAPATTEPEIVPEPALMEDAPPVSERALVPERETPSTVEPKPTPKRKAPDAAKPKPAPKRKTPPAAAPAKPARAQPAAPPRPSTGPASWVIQVASVREQNRAYSLVQELRAKGFPAYMSEAQVKGKRWYRVRIGPELGRRQIESMALALRKKTGRQGQIQRYP